MTDRECVFCEVQIEVLCKIDTNIFKWLTTVFRHLRKISFIMSVRTELGSNETDLNEIWHLNIFFSKICRENSSFIKIWQEWGVLYTKTDVHLWSYLAHSFLGWKVFQSKIIEKIKTHILCSTTFIFRKSCRLWDKVEEYCTTVQATDDSMTHAHCMLDT